jgi:hypothetical protein
VSRDLSGKNGGTILGSAVAKRTANVKAIGWNKLVAKKSEEAKAE